MSEVLGSLWWLLVTLGLLVTFHEYGHFVVARRCGVKVLKFSIGFGPALWSRCDRHGTQFVIAAIPLGGYVKMLDEREIEGVVGPESLKGAHNRQPVLNRMAISAAGPAFNLIFTMAAFWLMFVIGKPDYLPVIGHVDHLAASAGFQSGDRITAVDGVPVATWSEAGFAILQGGMEHRDLDVSVVDATSTPRHRELALSTLSTLNEDANIYREIGLEPRHWATAPVIGAVGKDSAAEHAGLRVEDRILSIQGDAIADWRDVPEMIRKHAGPDQALTLTIRRGDGEQTLMVTPTRNPRASAQNSAEPVWLLGIGPKPADAHYDALLRYNPLAAVPMALDETWLQTRTTLVWLGHMLNGSASTKNISGIITIAQVANKSAQHGVAWFLNFLALISLSLAILNLLPIPILDGGHLLYYLIELIKGSPVSERAQIAGQYVGLTLLMALMGLAFYNDILRIMS
ncbi:MAG: RIP metalloprotease RseP [Rhodanobacter sp.]|jgi:regulator of sigma E protease|nr:RIP metalloprotease RseP [Rhodanobacter sp.]